MNNIKLIPLALFAIITTSLTALQIVIDDWHDDNQWTNRAANGASAQFYTSQTFSNLNTVFQSFPLRGACSNFCHLFLRNCYFNTLNITYYEKFSLKKIKLSK